MRKDTDGIIKGRNETKQQDQDVRDNRCQEKKEYSVEPTPEQEINDEANDGLLNNLGYYRHDGSITLVISVSQEVNKIRLRENTCIDSFKAVEQ